jgi:hypothetical protein
MSCPSSTRELSLLAEKEQTQAAHPQMRTCALAYPPHSTANAAANKTMIFPLFD